MGPVAELGSLAVMDSTRSLTQFQQTCESALRAALASEGLALAERTLAGETQTYIHGSVRGTDIEVYIYEDEAQFHRSGKLAGWYERPDFNDSAELQTAFIDGVLLAAHDS